MTIQMTREFTDTLAQINAGRNVLISGKAGTGKSTLLRLFLDQCVGKRVLVTAPTGVAALNVDGFTIHRAFSLRPGLFPDDMERGGNWHLSSQNRAVLEEIEILVVDEISMVRADLFDMMDKALRMVRRSAEPFGGVQVVLVGDLLQLPPVVTDNEREIFETRWKSPYFFAAECYPELDLLSVNLTTVWRQRDTEFIEVLNQVREGSVDEHAMKILNACVDDSFEAPKDWVTLTSYRRTVSKINRERLAKLPGEKFVSHAEYSGDANARQFSGEEVLEYCVGARVMTVVNDPLDRFVNGSFGEIIAADEYAITVLLDDNSEVVRLPKHTWEVKQPTISNGRLSSDVAGSITQFPVVLAWAITIHKSQGKTIPKCFINLSGGTQTDGQFYVALSRAVDLEHLRFSAPVEARHIRANNTLVRRIRREVSTGLNTRRIVFLAFDGVDFKVSQHVARIYCMILQDNKLVAEFGSWINPMADLGEFGRKNNIPSGGLAMAPTLGDFWPLLLRQAAGGIVVGDRLPMLERAVRHQEKGLDVALGVGYDVSDFGFEPSGTDVASRCQSMVLAYLDGKFTIDRGQPVPDAPAETEGAVFTPHWASMQRMELDRNQATESDIAWASYSGGSLKTSVVRELEETAELLSAWAISRGCWTQVEKDDVVRRAQGLGLPSPNVPPLESNEQKVEELLRPGTRVAFTGCNHLLDGPADHERLKEICDARNLVYKSGVSKSQCDVLVAGDIASMSRKAQNARAFGKPFILQTDFENWWHNGPFLSEAEPEPVIVVNEKSAEKHFSQAAATGPISKSAYEGEFAGTDSGLLVAGSADELLQSGTRVAFRGSTFVDGQLVPQGEALQDLCHAVGLEYKQAVTKTRCDVLVTDSLTAQDGKVGLALRYGKPAILSDDFTKWAEARLKPQSEELVEEYPLVPGTSFDDAEVVDEYQEEPLLGDGGFDETRYGQGGSEYVSESIEEQQELVDDESDWLHAEPEVQKIDKNTAKDMPEEREQPRAYADPEFTVREQMLNQPKPSPYAGMTPPHYSNASVASYTNASVGSASPIGDVLPSKARQVAKKAGVMLGFAFVAFVLVIVFGAMEMIPASGISLLISMVLAVAALVTGLVALIYKLKGK